ncbi:hypothetical protein HA402_012928 [Bradysia odoriphaga]|nr:hypothetical protein HA402_012928 [Bradysia odoriphaga]
MATSPAASRGLVALFKRGWHEIPEVVGSGVMAVIGLGLGTFGLWKYYAEDGENRRFKQSMMIYRPDDPRVAKIRYD